MYIPCILRGSPHASIARVLGITCVGRMAHRDHATATAVACVNPLPSSLPFPSALSLSLPFFHISCLCLCFYFLPLPLFDFFPRDRFVRIVTVPRQLPFLVRGLCLYLFSCRDAHGVLLRGGRGGWVRNVISHLLYSWRSSPSMSPIIMIHRQSSCFKVIFACPHHIRPTHAETYTSHTRRIIDNGHKLRKIQVF